MGRLAGLIKHPDCAKYTLSYPFLTTLLLYIAITSHQIMKECRDLYFLSIFKLPTIHCFRYLASYADPVKTRQGIPVITNPSLYSLQPKDNVALYLTV